MLLKQKTSLTRVARTIVVGVLVAAGSAIVVLTATAVPASAADGCGGADTAIIKCPQDNTGSDISNNAVWGLLLIAINIMTAGVGVLAVGGIVYGAILYTTAEDKADQVKKAIDIITNVVIGLVAFALMWAGLNFLIPGGVFS